MHLVFFQIPSGPVYITKFLWHKCLPHTITQLFQHCLYLNMHAKLFNHSCHVIHFWHVQRITWLRNERKAILAIVKERICLIGQMMKRNFY